MVNKYVESWQIEELPNGVIKVVITCTQRELYYHAFMDNEFLITGTEEEYENYDENLILTVPEFLPDIEGIFLQSSFKEKEQLYFFYTPYLWEWKKEKKILFKS